jgi:hypothetical protein
MEVPQRSRSPRRVEAMLAGEVGPRGSTQAARTAETASAALDLLRRYISVAMSTAMAANRGLPRGRRQLTTSEARCRRDRWRSRASLTCRTALYSRAMPKVFSPPCARRSRVELYGHRLEASCLDG